MNVVRAANYDTTLFMDVSEVDALLQCTGTLSGGVTNLGATPVNSKSGVATGATVGSVTGTLSYQDSPTIRYFPLLGQALVAQMTTPITVDSIVSLYDSDWHIGTVLDLAADRLTPGGTDFYSVVNAIMELDAYECIVFSQGKSKGSLELEGNYKSPLQNDVLTLFIMPDHPELDREENECQVNKRIANLWLELLQIYGCQDEAKGQWQAIRDYLVNPPSQTWPTYVPRCIHIPQPCGEAGGKSDSSQIKITLLDSAPIQPKSPVQFERLADRQIPYLRLRSAMGILHNAIGEDFPLVAILDKGDFEAIRGEAWNISARHFYTLTWHETKTICDKWSEHLYKKKCDNETEQPGVHDAKVDAWLNRFKDNPNALKQQKNSQLFMYSQDPTDSNDGRNVERVLGLRRRYMLIIMDKSSPPGNAYAKAEYNGLWYYIDEEDKISQENFRLLSHFLTIQAVASQTPPLTPSLSVGGAR